ncbi:ribokinase [Pelagicoccus sp. SDUM812005]|uniref:ribokinase n=1 Tax=Pelagicoccus sp. SDUM812005 TaxID=3041257 RepID=UPI00280D68C8|nr:ribokinase [Pelagicoccus sp. SDUM812005]MDQ8180768.1 ribokinase [Pelagicoccus sp. SDUM812005]
MSDIVVLGSLNADLVVSVDRAPAAGETVPGRSFAVFNGGKGANQAFAAARMGGEVAMLGRVGDDAYGRGLLGSLESVGVAVEGVRCIEGVTTGVASITVEAGGENRIVVVPGANGAYCPVELERDAAFFKGAKLALFQLETPLETVVGGLQLARERGCITILDPAPARELGEEALSLVDYLTPNLSELALLSQRELGEESSAAEIVAAAKSLLDYGVGKVLAKLGERGAILVSRQGVERVYAVSVRAVDSTGAGDCFNGAFAAALSRGVAPLEAARFACMAASISVSRAGAQDSFPSVEEVLKGA